MRDYLLIAQGDHEVWGSFFPEENERLDEASGQWISDIDYGWIRGRGIGDRKVEISKAKGDSIEVVRDPHATDSGVTGYFRVQAEDWDEAIELAKECPALLHDALELFQLQEAE